MADERMITIRLVSESSNGTSDNVQDSEERDNGVLNDIGKALHPVRTLGATKLGKTLVVVQAFNYAKEAVKSSVTYGINRSLTLREDYFAEQSFNNTMNIIGKAVSFTGAVAAGGITGSAGGPIGIVAGMAIAGAGWIGNEAIAGWQKFDRQDIRIAEMNYGSSFSLTRLGLTDGGKGTEN